MAVRINEVAHRAGVSSATVSRVLAEEPHVREAVRQRVLQAVRDLGYRPSRIARSLRTQSSQILGLIISDIQNPFFTALVRAVEDQAHANQYAIFLCNSDESPKKEALYVDLLLEERVAGVIVAPARPVGSSIYRLVEAHTPVVTIDRCVTDLQVDSVKLDNVSAAYRLIDYLLELGHRRIGAILGAQEITTGAERFQGYTEALAHRGIPLETTLVRRGMPKEPVGYALTKELLSLADPPTALFAGNNLLTVGAIQALREKQITFPKDISLVAFDDLNWTNLINPRLTVAAQPTYQMGQAAMDMLLNRIAHPDLPVQNVVFQSELKIRESCLPLARAEKGASLRP